MAMKTPWELTHISEESYHACGLGALNEAKWEGVEIPCTVQTSPFGLPIERLYVRDNIENLEWMRERCWVFRTSFRDVDVREDEEALYQFLGIDYDYEIYLDGNWLLRREGMFSPVEIPIPGSDSIHELTVVILPFRENRACPDNLKARMTAGYGWDFAPRLLTAGIWDEARIVVRKKLRITGVCVETVLSNTERADVVVHVDLSEKVPYGSIKIRLNGVSRKFPVVHAEKLALPLNIPSPDLWWPNGAGRPNLVELSLELAAEGRLTERFTQRVGLRSIGRLPCTGQGAEDTPLQLVINGRKIFVKGVNWVPADACIGSVEEDRYALFLGQFREAGVNLIRVWGGGLKEKDVFYRLADEMGLMVMQEFPLACQKLSRAPKFFRLLEQEITAIIHGLKHHPSIVLWSGGNEHYHFWDRVDSGTDRMEAIKEEVRSLFGIEHSNREWRGGADRYDEPTLAFMGHLCALLDPSRPYQITSAMEGEGDVHGIWNWRPAIGDHRYRDYDTLYEYWLDTDQHFYSECSVSSAANLETVKQVSGQENPSIPEDDDPVWKLHNAFGAAWDSRDLWLDKPAIMEMFGPQSDLESLITASQWLQAEGGRFMIEEIRRRTGRTGGIIWWGVNEPWPSLAGNALIDYFGQPKQGWSFLKNAFKPTILSLRYENCVLRRLKPELWISHDGPEPFSGEYRVTVHNLSTGEMDSYSGKIVCGPYEARLIKVLTPVRMSRGTQVQVECRLLSGVGDEPVHRNEYLFASDEDPHPFAGLLFERIIKWRYESNA